MHVVSSTAVFAQLAVDAAASLKKQRFECVAAESSAGTARLISEATEAAAAASDAFVHSCRRTFASGSGRATVITRDGTLARISVQRRWRHRVAKDGHRKNNKESRAGDLKNCSAEHPGNEQMTGSNTCHRAPVRTGFFVSIPYMRTQMSPSE